MHSFFLSTHGVEAREQEKLQAAIALAAPFLTDHWSLSHTQMESVPVCATLVAVDRPEDNPLSEKNPPHGSQHPIIAYGDEPAQCTAHWHLSKNRNNQPSLREITELLNRLARSLRLHRRAAKKASATSEPELKPVKARAKQQYFDPEHSLLGLIHTAVKDQCARRYSLSGHPDLLIFPKKDLYYSSAGLDELTPLFQAPAASIQVKRINILKLVSIMDRITAKSRPLEELLWSAALLGSEGRLMKGFNDREVIQLKYWPDISHLPNYGAYLPVAAFLNNNAADLQTIASRTEKPLASVYNFHNACEALGLLERGVNPQMLPASDKTSEHALYRTISQRLGGIHARNEHAL